MIYFIDKPTLFPTEEGAPLGDETFGALLNVSEKKHIRKFGRFRTEDEKAEAKKLYDSVRPNTLPEDVAARWRWAIKKVITMNLLRGRKIGFTRTRLEKKQTFIGRLDRIQANLYDRTRELRNDLMRETGALNHKIDTKTEKLDLEVSSVAKKVDSIQGDMQEQVTGLNGQITNIHAMIEDVKTQLKQAADGENQQLKDALTQVHAHCHEAVRLDLDRMQDSLGTIIVELGDVDTNADKLLQKVNGMSALSATAMSRRGGEAEPVDVRQHVDQLVELMQIDTVHRETKEEAAALKSAVEVINRFYTELRRHILSLHEMYGAKFQKKSKHGPFDVVSPLQMEQLQTLFDKCTGVGGRLSHLGSVSTSLQRAFKEHDMRLESKIKALSRIVEEGAGPGIHGSRSLDGGDGEGPPIGRQLKEALNDFDFRLSVIENSMPDQQDDADIDDEASFSVGKKTSALPTAAPSAPVPNSGSNSGGGVGDGGGGAGGEDNDTLGSASKSPRRGGGDEDSLADLQSINTANSPINRLRRAPSQRARVGSVSSQVILETKLRPMIERIVELNLQRRFDAEFGENGSVGSFGQDVTPLEMVPIDPSVRSRSKSRMSTDVYIPSASSSSSPQPVTGSEPRENPSMVQAMHSAVAAVNATDSPTSRTMKRSPRSNTAAGAGGDAGAAANTGPATTAGNGGAPSISPRLSPRSTSKSKGRASSTISTAAVSESGPAPGSPSSRSQQPRKGRDGGVSFVLRRSVTNSNGAAFDPSFLIDDMTELKNEAKDVLAKVDKLKEESMNHGQVEDLCKNIIRMEKQRESRSEHMRAVQELERSVREVVQELVTTKKQNNAELEKMKADFARALEAAIGVAVDQATDNNTDAVVNTRALCLVCGRNSNVRGQSQSRPTSPALLPSLNQHSLPGPDVYRSGFKIPVRAASPPSYSRGEPPAGFGSSSNYSNNHDNGGEDFPALGKALLEGGWHGSEAEGNGGTGELSPRARDIQTTATLRLTQASLGSTGGGGGGEEQPHLLHVGFGSGEESMDITVPSVARERPHVRGSGSGGGPSILTHVQARADRSRDLGIGNSSGGRHLSILL